MAPGVFLTSRRPSLSPQNSSGYSPSAPSPAGMASPGSAGTGQGKCGSSAGLDSECLESDKLYCYFYTKVYIERNLNAIGLHRLKKVDYP